MYSMAREHMDSKMALVKAGALRALATTLLATRQSTIDEPFAVAARL